MSDSIAAVVARNTLYQFIAKGITMMLSMLSFSLIARFLPVDQYGQFTLISSIFALAIGISDLRIEQVVVREMTEQASAISRLISHALILKFLFALVVSALTIVIVLLTGYSEIIKLNVSLAMVGVLVTALFAGFHAHIQYAFKAYLLTFGEVIAKVAVTVLVVIVYWLGSRALLTNGQALPLFVIVTLIVSPLLVAICYAFWSLALLSARLDFRLDKSLIRSLLRQSWPLWLLGLLALAHYRSGVLVLSFFQPEYDVGIFGLAYRLLDVAVTLPPLFIASIYPLMSRHVAQGSEKTSAILVQSFNFVFLFVLLLAAGTFYASDQVIALFGGQDYAQASDVLRILCFAMVGSYLSSIFVPYLVAHYKQRMAVWTLAVSVLVNIGLNLYLIPRYSYTGAAIAIAISELLGFILIATVVIKTSVVRLDLTVIAKALLSMTLMLVGLQLSGLASLQAQTVWQSGVTLLAIGVVGVGLYGFFVLSLRTIEKEMLEAALSMLPLPAIIKRWLHG